MIAIAFITFRESLEMLLVFGILLTSLRQSKINKKNDLLFGSVLGLFISICLFVLFSFAGSKMHVKMNMQTSELFESLNYLGSGLFLFIAAILLHNKMRKIVNGTSSALLDASLFTVGFLSVLREGTEIIVFSISTSILSPFSSSLVGFGIGLLSTLAVFLLSKQWAFAKLSHTKMVIAVDWGIKLLSLYLIIKGLVGLSEFIF